MVRGSHRREAQATHAAGETERARGRDHGLRGNAVPKVRRSPDNIALHERYARTEAGGPAGGLIAGRPSPDDYHAGHGTLVMARWSWHAGHGTLVMARWSWHAGHGTPRHGTLVMAPSSWHPRHGTPVIRLAPPSQPEEKGNLLSAGGRGGLLGGSGSCYLLVLTMVVASGGHRRPRTQLPGRLVLSGRLPGARAKLGGARLAARG